MKKFSVFIGLVLIGYLNSFSQCVSVNAVGGTIIQLDCPLSLCHIYMTETYLEKTVEIPNTNSGGTIIVFGDSQIVDIRIDSASFTICEFVDTIGWNSEIEFGSNYWTSQMTMKISGVANSMVFVNVNPQGEWLIPFVGPRVPTCSGSASIDPSNNEIQPLYWDMQKYQLTTTLQPNSNYKLIR